MTPGSVPPTERGSAPGSAAPRSSKPALQGDSDPSESATAAPLTSGSLARVIEPAIGENVRAGTEFVIEYYVDPSASEDGEAFYWGSSDGGVNNVWVLASCVEQVKTAAEMEARRPPSREDVAKGLHLLSDHGCFEADESEPDGAAVNLYGTTYDGLRIAVRLEVAAVYETDL